MDAGRLVSDDIMIPVLDGHLPRSGGVVIDSLRSSDQVRWLKKTFPQAMTLTFLFEVSEREILRRLRGAENTDRGVRADDAVVNDRLARYNEYLPKIRPYLLGQTNYEHVDANGPLDEVLRQVFTICDQWGLKSTSTLVQA